MQKLTLRNKCQNFGFFCAIFGRINIEMKILPLYRKMHVRENPCFGIF